MNSIKADGSFTVTASASLFLVCPHISGVREPFSGHIKQRRKVFICQN
jgi:hypothetical protein